MRTVMRIDWPLLDPTLGCFHDGHDFPAVSCFREVMVPEPYQAGGRSPVPWRDNFNDDHATQPQ